MGVLFTISIGLNNFFPQYMNSTPTGFDLSLPLFILITYYREKTIVESSYDDIWGTGLPLSDSGCLNRSKWKLIGILGRTLMNILGLLSSTNTECQPNVPETV